MIDWIVVAQLFYNWLHRVQRHRRRMRQRRYPRRKSAGSGTCTLG